MQLIPQDASGSASRTDRIAKYNHPSASKKS